MLSSSELQFPFPLALTPEMEKSAKEGLKIYYRQLREDVTSTDAENKQEEQFLVGRLLLRGSDVPEIPKNPSLGFEFIFLAARLGHINAIYELGLCYLQGLGIEQDLSEAIAIFSLAEELGDRLATVQLASINSRGVLPQSNNKENKINETQKPAETGNGIMCPAFQMAIQEEHARVHAQALNTTPLQPSRKRKKTT